MFQYALYLQLKSLGKDVKMDDRTGFEHDLQRTPALAPFGIAYETATAEELECMLDASLRMRDRIRRKLRGRNKKAYFEADKRYKPEILSWDDIYLEGYWQTEKYFSGVSAEVREAYDVERLLRYIRTHACRNGCGCATADGGEPEGKEPSGAKQTAPLFEKYLAQITSEESVSVHIRGGDYLLPENRELFGGICTAAYYREAMAGMRREHPGCTFYIFTNDKQRIREQIARAACAADDETGAANMDAVVNAGLAGDTHAAEITDSIVIVDMTAETEVAAGQRDYAEFVLMSRCRHHILANSSFSWWASYLHDDPHKTVYAPDRWLNGWDCSDFYREDMQKIMSAERDDNGETEETIVHE